MRWTEDQLADFRARRGAPVLPDVSAPPFKLPPNEPGRYALGRLPTGQMNKTEAAYEAHLTLMRNAGQILWFKFEAVKLRLADKTFYTPDFVVLRSDGLLEMREVKGFMMEDANVKIKVAASIYPFRFMVVRVCPKKDGGGWIEEEI